MRDNAIACEACGDYPVNHAAMYFSKTFDAWGSDRLRSLERLIRFDRLSEPLRKRVILLVPHLIRGLHAVYGRKTFSEPDHVSMERAAVIWQEAKRRGLKMEQLTLFGFPIDSYRVRLDDRWVYFESLPIPPRTLADSIPYIDDKALFKEFLNRHRIPTARSAIATDLQDARSLLDGLRLPVVVKPRLGSNSRHTTPFIQTPAEFESAFRSAQQLCRYVLIEEHIFGHLCRATVVDGTLVGFLESRQPWVTGDGRHSVYELIAEKNRCKVDRVSDIILTPENEAHIRRQGFAPDSILAQGISVAVARLPGRNSGGENREMPAHVHPKLRQYVEKTAQLMHAPLIGFDLIVRDPEADPDTQEWGFLEANTVPFIEIHNDPLYGQSSNVAAAVWDLWQTK